MFKKTSGTLPMIFRKLDVLGLFRRGMVDVGLYIYFECVIMLKLKLAIFSIEKLTCMDLQCIIYRQNVIKLLINMLKFYV